ncbi:MAG: hypothetical protein LBQ98_08995 [Nitrososphaerota archaeon]|jgi:hypothetical protein|nr:hypothetical protein [Nitrososphaerota archaeon]
MKGYALFVVLVSLFFDFLRSLDIQFDRLFYKLDLIPQTPRVKIAADRGLLRGINNKGYYDYDYQDSGVASLSSIWDYLQAYHMNFLSEIWYTYKDVKNWGQRLPDKAEKSLIDISELSLEIFNNLCGCTGDGSISTDVRNEHIDIIIKRRKQEVKSLHDKIDKNFGFQGKKQN